MITNDTLMRDATYREWVAAKIYAEDVDMCVEGAVNETDKLIARLNETAKAASCASALVGDILVAEDLEAGS